MTPDGAPIATSNGSGHGRNGRFEPGNSAARRHGLRAGSRQELRRRNRRLSLRLRGYLNLRADQGRPIAPTQLALARRYCELDILATDKYALVVQDPTNEKALDQYLAVANRLLSYGDKLGESTATVDAHEARRAPDWQVALASLREDTKAALPEPSK